MTPRIFIAVFAICFAVAVSGQSLPATDPLEQLWGVAQIYFGDDKTASMTAQKDTGYISYNMGVMTLYKGSNVYTVNVMPDIFNQFEELARTRTNLDEGGLNTAIESYRNALYDRPPAIFSASRGLSAAQYARMTTLVDATVALLDQVLSDLAISDTSLASFGTVVQPLIDQNMNDSAVALLNSIHAQVLAWQQAYFTPDEWSNVHISIIGTHMRRSDHTVLQYFNRLMNSTSGTNVVYAEGLADGTAMDLMATHLVDFRLGLAFWKRGLYTHQDLMGPFARVYLDTLLASYHGIGEGDDGSETDNSSGSFASTYAGGIVIGLFAAVMAFVVTWRFVHAVRDYKPRPVSQ